MNVTTIPQKHDLFVIVQDRAMVFLPSHFTDPIWSMNTVKLKTY